MYCVAEHNDTSHIQDCFGRGNKEDAGVNITQQYTPCKKLMGIDTALGPCSVSNPREPKAICPTWQVF